MNNGLRDRWGVITKATPCKIVEITVNLSIPTSEEIQAASNLLIQRLKAETNECFLPDGESYQSIANDSISEVKEVKIVAGDFNQNVTSIARNALLKIKEWYPSFCDKLEL